MTQKGTRPHGDGLLGVAHADLAAIAETKIANLERAVRTARTIGIALGILMERAQAVK
jgi:hypothetical protein